MTPNFPHNIKIRLAKLKSLFFLRPDVAKCLPCWLPQFRKAELRQPTGQTLSNIRTQETKIAVGPILFLYYVSSNLNSKQLRFHGIRPNVNISKKKE